MTGRILIVDPVVTSRIVLKVKLAAAYYSVADAANMRDAVDMLPSVNPDLIFCEHRFGSSSLAELAPYASARNIPIIALTPKYCVEQRCMAFADGASDVISRPYDEIMIFARLRNLLRRRALRDELGLQSGTYAALGLAEAPQLFQHRARVGVVANTARNSRQWADELRQYTGHDTFAMSSADVMQEAAGKTPLDGLILGLDGQNAQQRVDLISNLRSRPEGQNLALLGVSNLNQGAEMAAALNSGAGDVMPGGFEPREIAERLNRLLDFSAERASIRNSLRAGLEAAMTDPLTGLHNRRYALSFLDRLIRSGRRLGTDFAVMLIDLDHFKRVNDTFGHAVGDQVLVEFGERIKGYLKEDHLLARVGGEEFLIALPNISSNEAKKLANSLRLCIKSRPFAVDAGFCGVGLSISIGVAMGSQPVSPDGDDPSGLKDPISKLLERADHALYTSKEQGRDMVNVFQSAA